MNTIQTSLLALLAVMILTLSMSLTADQSDQENPVAGELLQGDVVAQTDPVSKIDTAAETELITASSRKPVNTSSDSAVALTDASEVPSTGDQDNTGEQDTPHQDAVWGDISDAITSLNDMVGDDMFRQLTRKNSTTMEVRVDLDYWQRVRYETRVDLKNDISNIWHLYVEQYNKDNESAVYFIDDLSGKTIDIFTQRRRSGE